MNALTLKAIAFTPLTQRLFETETTTSAAFQWLTQLLAAQTTQIVQTLPLAQQSQVERHFLCSTMIELPFTTGDISWKSVSEMLEKHGNHQADTFINAYECASWGYSLRHYLQHNKQSKFLLVSIIDANIFDLEFWRYNEHWHESGFGITTVLIEVNGKVTNEVITQCANTHNSMAEFATVIRRHATGLSDTTLAMPFFPDNIVQMFDKLLANQIRLDDLHAQWGHCFGADPWLSILTHCRDNPVLENQQYLACSLALNGYFAMANVTVTPDTHFILQETQGYE